MMKRVTKSKIAEAFVAAIICFTLLPQITANAHQGATGIVKKRMDHFSEARQQLRQLRGAVAAEDFEKITQIAADMRPWSQEMADYFPAGSYGAPSEALPTIWTDPEGFAARIADYSQAVLALNEAALTKDIGQIKGAYAMVGASCKSCHSGYRK